MTTTRTRMLLPALLAGAALLAGCASGMAPEQPGEGAPADDETSEQQTDEGSGEQALAVGSVEVSGTEYAIIEVRRCEPLDDGTIDRELELQGLGETADGERVQIDVYVQSVGGAPMDDVSWSGPEGVFGGAEDAQIELEGSQISGTATLVDAATQEDTLDVRFAMTVPDEEISCR